MKQLTKNKQGLPESILILFFTLLWNQSVYYGSRLIAHTRRHYDMTLPIDQLVPFLPWTVSIYFGCYLFWGVNYWLCVRQEKTARDRFFCADVLAKGICFLFFVLLPTTNIRPDIAGKSIWDALMNLLYTIDAADNLFPSIHCLVSWLCWIGVRRRKEIPAIYRCFSLTAAIVICISTITTRQHVIADVGGGILLAEACYYAAGYPSIRSIYSTGISRLKRLFRI